MKRRLNFLLIAGALACGLWPQRALAESWNQVLLFDWVYPGEPGYQALKQADSETGGNNWLTARMARGEKLPQASVRELAARLWDDARVDEATRASLKKLYTDEPQQLTTEAGELKELSNRLDESSKKLDELQASLDANRYGKGSTPAINMDLFGAYRLDHPSGLDQADSHSYLLGGMNLTFMSTIDKINFIFSLAGQYNNNDASNPTPYSFLNIPGIVKAGASFQIPLSNGGLEVHLDDNVDINFSPLTLSGIFPGVRDPFFVDVSQAYRGPTALKALDLDYPSATVGERGIYVRHQGRSWYWPFTLTQFLYAPEDQALMSYTYHMNFLDARFDEDISGHWGLDVGRLYYVFQVASNDKDQIAGQGLPPAATNNFHQSSTSQAFGFNTRIDSWGTEIKLDAAVSQFNQDLGPVGSPTLSLADSAWLGNFIQPVGPVRLAVEAGAAGPEFLAGPRFQDYTQPGSTQNTLAYFSGAEAVGLTPPTSALYWISYIKDPTILSNNTSRLALKGEWHGSWMSVGLYDGVQPQQNATNSLVMTQPYLEGHDFDGFGFFRMFGAGYTLAAPPGTVPNPGVTTPVTGFPFYDNSLRTMALFNVQTDGNGVANNGISYPVHWQRLTQYGYKGTEFATVLSKNGVGDSHFDDDSVKTLNYAGGRLIFDLAALSGRELPLEVDVIGEARDLAEAAGVPSLDPVHYFNQQISAAYVTGAVTPAFTLLGMIGYETWRSDHSYYPLNMQILEYGAGWDWKLDSLVTGLQMNVRATDMEFQDLNIYSRGLSLVTIGTAMTLSY